jgi:anti-sigma regulatory factor (Ser/Thr protein kinase)
MMQFKLKDKQLLGSIIKWIAKIRVLNIEESENIKIALGEALQNIIRHGYKNNLVEKDFIEIKYERDNEKLILLLRDYAPPCESEIFLKKSFRPNESGHMGISIIRKLTDEFTIKPLQDGNETKLVFKFN